MLNCIDYLIILYSLNARRQDEMKMPVFQVQYIITPVGCVVARLNLRVGIGTAESCSEVSIYSINI